MGYSFEPSEDTCSFRRIYMNSKYTSYLPEDAKELVLSLQLADNKIRFDQLLGFLVQMVSFNIISFV